MSYWFQVKKKSKKGGERERTESQRQGEAAAAELRVCRNMTSKLFPPLSFPPSLTPPLFFPFFSFLFFFKSLITPEWDEWPDSGATQQQPHGVRDKSGLFRIDRKFIN